MLFRSSPIDEVISNEKLSDAGMENMQVAKRNTDRMLRQRLKCCTQKERIVRLRSMERSDNEVKQYEEN